MAASVTPQSLKGPTAKEKKYDRQLRLWAASGQQALEDGHILLLNNGGGVAGVETLKNLVLPGIGHFTILDEHNVREEDLGANFFLEEASLGKSRAEECCKFLKELNPEVNGHAIQKPIEEFIADHDLAQYTLVILISPTKLGQVLRKVIDFTWSRSIPLFYVHSIGFYSQFSLQLPPLFPIVDTHPDPASTQDLRLLRPWGALSHLVHDKTKNLGSKSDHEHGHIPYVLLLLHYMEEWKGSHNGAAPKNYREKTQFRDLVEAGMRRNNAEGGEENFEEAMAAVLKSLNISAGSSGLWEIFDEDECKHPTSKSPNFWIIAHAMSIFIFSNGGVPPLPGTLPDMKAQSSDYIELQTVYKNQALKDSASVAEQVRKLEARLGRRTSIDSKEIDAFCKNATFVKLVKGRKLRVADEPHAMDWSDRGNYMAQQLGDEESLMPILIAMLAFDVGVEHSSGLPPFSPHSKRSLGGDHLQSKFKDGMDEYVRTFLAHLSTIDSGFNLDEVTERVQKVVAELARAGPAELHNISALTGGMVAQEAIKVITKQYVPVDNTCVFNGITSKTAVFRL